MNNDQYISILKKRLSTMDRSARDEILLEINSHADALGDSNESLFVRFGDPEILAQRYLEDEPVPASTAQKARGIGSRILTGIGIAVLVLILGLAALYYIYAGDEFDYANEQAPQLSLDGAEWTTMSWSQAITLVVEQSQVIVYWNDRDLIGLNCKGSSQLPKDHQGKIKISQSSCLVSLPRQKAVLQARQSSLVVVRPQASAQIELSQSSMRIAENDSRYRYAIDKLRSEIGDFKSKNSAEIEIQIAATESTISRYSY